MQMFQCPRCDNTDRFSVIEIVKQRSTLACTDADGGSYSIEESTFLDLEAWQELTCLACGAVIGEDEARDLWQAERSTSVQE
jgi:transcription elongation factor Elf1